MTKIVTRQSLEEMVSNPSREYREMVIGRALLVLLENQTADEQRDAETKYHNKKGFTSGDGKGGVLTAKYFRRHGKLLDWQLEKWERPGRIAKYHRQLNERAEANRK